MSNKRISGNREAFTQPVMDLEVFFQEKEIPYTSWEIEHEGCTNIIDSEVVIESILETHGIERSKIANMLFSLDFRNASIVDFLHFLAKCLVRERYKRY